MFHRQSASVCLTVRYNRISSPSFDVALAFRGARWTGCFGRSIQSNDLPASLLSGGDLMEIPAFDLQRVDVKIRDENIANLVWLRPISSITAAGRTVCELVTASGRMPESGIAVG